MEQKTKIRAEDGKQELTITREFDLPVDLLFKAHVDPDLFEEWMSHEYGRTKVLKFECRKHGAWQFQNVDLQGNVVFTAGGTFHDVVLNEKIVRTFEMENTPFDVQLEFLQFEKITADTSLLSMQIIYRSLSLRDQMVKLPFAQGLNMAHNRLQNIVSKLK